jgi:hypothetical protein
MSRINALIPGQRDQAATRTSVELWQNVYRQGNYSEEVLDTAYDIHAAMLNASSSKCTVCGLQLPPDDYTAQIAHCIKHARDNDTAPRPQPAKTLPIPIPSLAHKKRSAEDEEPRPILHVPFEIDELPEPKNMPDLGFDFITKGNGQLTYKQAFLTLEKLAFMAKLVDIVGPAIYAGCAPAFMREDCLRFASYYQANDFEIPNHQVFNIFPEWRQFVEQMEAKAPEEEAPAGIRHSFVYWNPTLDMIVTEAAIADGDKPMFIVCRNLDTSVSFAGLACKGLIDYRFNYENLPDGKMEDSLYITVNQYKSYHPVWLFSSSSCRGLGWTRVLECGSLVAFKVYKTAVDNPLQERKFTESILDSKHYGPVDMRCANTFNNVRSSTFTPEQIMESRAFSFCGVVAFTPPEKVTYILPKGLISELTGSVTGNVRSADLLTSVLRSASTRVGRYNVPAESSQEVALLCGHIAFTKHLALETRLAAAVPLSRLALHAHLSRFRPSVDLGKFMSYLMILAAFVAAVLFWYWQRPEQTLAQVVRCRIVGFSHYLVEPSYYDLLWYYLGYCELPALAVPPEVVIGSLAVTAVMGRLYLPQNLPRFYVVFVAPYCEEALKRWSRYFIYFIVILETLLNGASLWGFVFSLFAHQIMYLLPMHTAVPIHMMWNYVATEPLAIPWQALLLVAVFLLIRHAYVSFQHLNTDPYNTTGQGWRKVGPTSSVTTNLRTVAMHVMSKLRIKLFSMKRNRDQVCILAGHSTGPVYSPSQNAHNGIIGATHRAAMVTSENPYAAANFWCFVHEEFDTLYEDHEKWFADFTEEKWDLFTSRYPIHLRLILTKAREKSRQFDTHYFKKDFMIKMEKTVGKLVNESEPIGPSGFHDEGLPEDELAPRIITISADELKANLGPPLLAIHEIMKRMKKGYAPGKTAEELGKWFDQASELIADFVEIDVSRWDARFGPIMSHLELSIYERFGSKSWATPCGLSVHELLCATINVSVGNHDLSYNVVATRKSGDYNTTTGNTCVNLDLSAWEASVILRTILAELNMLVLAAGDDKLQAAQTGTFYRPEFKQPPDGWLEMDEEKLQNIDPDLVVVRDWMRASGSFSYQAYDSLKKIMTRLASPPVLQETKQQQWGVCHEAIGMKTKLQVHDWSERRKASFCSGRFYPTEDGSVLGPLVGRQLRKAAWMFNHAPSDAEGWLKSVMVGNFKGWSYVPLLRVMVKFYVDRLDSVKAKKLHLQEKNEKKYSVSHQASQAHRLTYEALDMFQLIYGHSMTEAEDVLLHLLGQAPLGSYLLHPLLQDIDRADN